MGPSAQESVLDIAPSEKTPLLDGTPSSPISHWDGEKGLERGIELKEQRQKGRAFRRWRNHNVQLRAFRVAVIATLCFALLHYFSILKKPSLSESCKESSATAPSSQNPESLAYVSNYTCVPGLSCWPLSAEWSAFNRSIGGNLKTTVPWAAPCYGGSESKECTAVANDYMGGIARTKQYGSMEFLDWESCGESSCTLNSFSPSSPVSGTCSLGRLSTYYVDARSPDDIRKTLNFVREHGIRISIKNTGHDYFGRSNAANSLAIWTHNMKKLAYHGTFRPKGCKTQYKDVGEIGAGVQAQEVWEFFEPLDMMVTVGAVGSVGIAGGFGQGGGHGPLGPAYGLMVDQAIEFDVVTADGQLRTINECTDPDLFWAMRGGGGGTYAVLTSYKFQLHPAVPLNVYSFQADFPTTMGDLDISQSQAHRDIIRALASNQTLFAQHGIAGYNFIHPDHMISILIQPNTDTTQVKQITAQWQDFLSSYPGLNITENTYHTFHKFSDWHTFTETPSIARNGPVGIGISESGRLLPKSLFNTEGDIEAVVDAVLAAMHFSYENHASGTVHLYATTPFNTPDEERKTGVNPAWRDALWHVIIGGIWTKATSPEKRSQIQDTISKAIQPFKELTPAGGCYANEGDWMEEDWQKTFFGENYAKLEEIKRRWDSGGLFNCWKCVGWTGYEDPMYSCYAQSKKTPKPTIPLGPVD